MSTVFLGLGANLGDRTANLAAAREALAPVMRIQRASRVYESEPVGLRQQPLFLNQVVQGETVLRPGALLGKLKEIERQMGRLPGPRYGPRPIDLDIILFDDWVIGSAELVVPHPRFRERSFVLAPLAEIAPELRDPLTGERIAELWDRVAPFLARAWVYEGE
ncbi:MAG: 2-amino-4-hydroxy-6-hydroxymethyldihydropteridine diphosphokinase [Firmicutes bacterium]|nr:2-amino-4-hydroxy-6-hydroxymethyldihydropteridine diphosphokinase [Bacillota bacterium]